MPVPPAVAPRRPSNRCHRLRRVAADRVGPLPWIPDFLNPFGAIWVGRSVTQIETDSVFDFKATVYREHQRIWRYLVYLGCDEHRAADLTQEAFLRLLDSEFE